jgi:hypothetical protein
MPREKSITDLKDERTQLSIRAKAITDGARAEKRMLNEGENTELGEIQCRMTDINMEIATKEAENRGKGTPHVEPGQERFSLRRSLANYISGQGQHDADASVIEAATRLHNSAGVTRSSQNSLVIPMSLEKRAMFTRQPNRLREWSLIRSSRNCCCRFNPLWSWLRREPDL